MLFFFLHGNTPKSLIFAKILPRISRISRISLEQKGTKETMEEFGFVAFVCLCANFILRAAWMENSESVKSVKSVVQFLWLRRAALVPFAAKNLLDFMIFTIAIQRGRGLPALLVALKLAGRAFTPADKERRPASRREPPIARAVRAGGA